MFTRVWDEDPDNPQLIELEFTEREDGTSVLMTNSAIPTLGRLKDQEGGWNRCYDNLERALATPSA